MLRLSGFELYSCWVPRNHWYHISVRASTLFKPDSSVTGTLGPSRTAFPSLRELTVLQLMKFLSIHIPGA